MIKCVMLNAHCTLIADIIEVDAELGNPNCKMIKPYVYNSIDDMVPWKADITNQTAVSYTHLTLPTKRIV